MKHLTFSHWFELTKNWTQKLMLAVDQPIKASIMSTLLLTGNGRLGLALGSLDYICLSASDEPRCVVDLSAVGPLNNSNALLFTLLMKICQRPGEATFTQLQCLLVRVSLVRVLLTFANPCKHLAYYAVHSIGKYMCVIC